MELRTAVRARRMVRRTSDAPLAASFVAGLCDLARHAPSAGFAQGAAFVVLSDEAARRKVADAGGEPDWVARGYEPWLSVAPVLVVPCVDHRAYRERYDEPDKATGPDAWAVPYAWVDAGAALQNLLLLATEASLAAGFLGAHAVPGLAALVGLPDGVEPLGVVTLGHPHPEGPRRTSASLARGWRDRSAVVHHDVWDAA